MQHITDNDLNGNFSGQHWIVGRVNNQPYVVETSQHRVEGYVPEIILYVAQKYGLTMEYVQLFTYGAFVNGTWNGLVKQLIEKKIDIGTNLARTFARNLVVDMSVPISNGNSDSRQGFICPFPMADESGNSFWGIFKPFQYQVWMHLFASLFGYTLAIRFLAKFSIRKNVDIISLYEPNKHWIEILWFLLRILLNARDSISTSFNLAGKLLTCIWCLMAVVFVNAYSGSVTSFLMSPNRLVPFADSVEDIAALAPRPILLLAKFSSGESFLMDGTSEVKNKIADTLREHPENRLTSSSMDEIANKINSGHCYLETDGYLRYMLGYDYVKTKSCRLYIARSALPLPEQTIPLTKNSPIKNIVNREYLHLHCITLFFQLIKFVSSYYGYTPQILFYVAQKYGFTIEYIQLLSFGVSINGTWNGLMGKLVKNEIDIGMNLYSIFDRVLVVDMSVPIVNTNLDGNQGFLCPFPVTDSNINSIAGIFKPFQYQVWIYLIASLFICSLVLRFVAWVKFPISTNILAQPKNFMEIFWFLLRRGLLNARDSLSITFNLAGKVLTCIWCLMTVVFVNAYSGSVTSFIMSPDSLVPMVDSIADVAALAPRPILMVNKFSAGEANFMGKAKIGDTLRNHPENRLMVGDRFDEIPDKINSNGGHCYLHSIGNLQMIMENDLKRTKTCRLYITRESWPAPQKSCIPLTKNNPMTDTVYKEINWLRQAGLLDAWRRQFFARPNKCSDPLMKKSQATKRRDDIEPMRLDQLKGIFTLFAAGTTISFLVFLCELIHNFIFVIFYKEKMKEVKE